MSTLPNPAPDHAADSSALVSSLAAPAILASRSLFTAGFTDELRVATLIEVAGAAAAMARQIALAGHVDLRSVMLQVTTPVDARAVLGRGSWLPTMVRPVPVPARPTEIRPAPTWPADNDTQLDLLTAIGGDR
ncbi:hypothetical protein Cme02nite_22990 [Catellatospora methionotrophica]|uniref:Uncharacterized protein n=1 Tax=Catellatospora methionotrophica TaxID=121620 RepID=A0A8J3PEB3_9ACTN|nr:hypothetical protein [Catellatospora methionotrophica]GIG13967.1 hypothetical protein Cme02nite_22990 [Catellatospora methionotrophica]